MSSLAPPSVRRGAIPAGRSAGGAAQPSPGRSSAPARTRRDVHLAPAPRMRRFLPLALLTTAVVTVLPAVAAAATPPRGSPPAPPISGGAAGARAPAPPTPAAAAWERPPPPTRAHCRDHL